MITEPGVAAANPKIVDRIRATPKPRLPFSCSFRSQCAEDWVTCAPVDAEQDSGHRSAVTKICCATAGLKVRALFRQELLAPPGDGCSSKWPGAQSRKRSACSAKRGSRTPSRDRVQVSNWIQYSPPTANNHTHCIPSAMPIPVSATSKKRTKRIKESAII